MANIDLSKYDLSELKGLQHDIDQQIKDREQQEIRKAREQIIAIAQQVGLPLEALVASGGRKAKGEKSASADKGAKTPAQYRNPNDDSQTWSGRGRQPKWIAEGLASGKSLDTFRI
jgi:DNA-binding protein H-NS